MEAMTSFVDAYRDEYGVEPICDVIEIAPSTYYEHIRRRQKPETAPARVKRDAVMKQEIQRVFDENFQVYGARKVWRQLKREGHDVARCTVERLMQNIGLEGVVRGKPVCTTVSDKAAPCPLDHVNTVQGTAAECAVGFRLHVCRDVGGLRLRGVRDRHLRAPDRWLARLALGTRGLRARCAGASHRRSTPGRG